MRNAFAIFKAEIRNVFSNVVTILIMVGLVVLPSLFGWFNELACWDVFNNMGNLKVAVANTDEGYKSDLYPLEVNVGEQVVSALRENDQIDWIIVDKDTALDGTQSGEYYAAIVIPENFSQAMLTFYQQDAESAKIIYYTNEKKNAIALKFTQAGAQTVSTQINQVFAETLADISLNIADSVATYADSEEVFTRVASMTDSIDRLATRMDQASNALSMYAALSTSAQRIATSSADLLDATRSNASEAAAAVEEGAESVGTTMQVLSEATIEMSDALSRSVQSVQALIEKLLGASDQVDYQAAIEALDDQIAALQELQDALQNGSGAYAADSAAAGTLESAAAADPAAAGTSDPVAASGSGHAAASDFAASAASDAIASVGTIDTTDSVAAVDKAIGKLTQLRENLVAHEGDAVVSVEAGEQAEEALTALEELSAQFDAELTPQTQALASDVDALQGSLSADVSALNQATSELSGSLTDAAAGLGAAASSISAAATQLATAATKLHGLAAQVREVVASGDVAQLRELLGTNVDALAVALSSPVAIERTAVFPVDNFGSAMTPFYSTLGLFIGALVTMVVVRPRPSRRVLEGLEGLDGIGSHAHVQPHEEFLGHFGIVAVVAFAQSTMLALGNWLFLQVQVENPLLFFLAFWVAAEVFMLIMYALVVSFANLGKAIGVVLLIMQVTACGGSYPLQILPDFVQALSPLMPAYHAVNAIRAAMFGVAGYDYVMSMAALLLFAVPALLLGLVLRKATARFMSWYLARVEESKLMA